MGVKSMEKRIPAILVCILSGSIIGWLLHTISPTSLLSLFGFFLAVFTGAYTFGFALFLSVRRGFLLSLFITGSLLLRFIGLRHILYPILFAVTILSFEHMVIQKQPDSD